MVEFRDDIDLPDRPPTEEPQPRLALVRWLEQQEEEKVRWILLAVLLLAGVADLATGLDVMLILIYLIPVAMAAWLLNTRIGVVTAVGASALWLLGEIAGGKELSSGWIWIWNVASMTGAFLVVAFAVSRMRRDRDYFRRLATHDPLTNLLNGREFRHVIEDELERMRRYGRPFTIAYLDLDNFKHVNDTMGHAVGDQVLRLIGRTLRTHTRRLDIAGRLGGDEFGVLFPETEAKGGLTAAEEIRSAIADLPLVKKTLVTLSIGMATFRTPPEGGVEEILRVADRMMYESKEAGRNRTTLSRTK